MTELCPNQGEHSTTRLALHPDGTPMISIGPAVDLSEPSPALDPEHSRQCMAGPPPAAGTEAFAVRPLLEQIAAMDDCIGQQTVGQIMAISQCAAAWLAENPPGQPVAIEPRGCPTPGACSCVEPAPPAAGEVAELVAKLRRLAAQNPLGIADPTITRAAELLALQQQVADLASDAVSALRYIEQSHGRLYGVGFDRVYEKADRLLPTP